MLSSLKEIYIMLQNINQSETEKEILLKKYLADPIFGKTLKKVLEYSTNKNIYNITKINYISYFDDELAAEQQHVGGIFNMLDFIISKKDDLSDEEISFFEKISSSDVETTEVVMRILNKQTGCGLTNVEIIKILKESEI